jgi:multidrug efflux pump subunit AcrB
MKRVASSFTVIVIFVALSVLGCALVPLLTVKLSPSRDLPTLSVSFSMPDRAPRLIEREVTSKLEGALAAIQGVKEVTSRSDNGYGSITLALDRHAQLSQVRFEASMLIRQIWPQLPEGVTYPEIALRKADERAMQPFMTFTVNASADPVQIQRYIEEHISPVLSRIPGVYRISLSGATPMEWHLTYDTDQLTSLHLTPADLQAAISNYCHSAFWGIHRRGNEWIRVASSPAEDLALDQIVLPTPDGQLITMDRLVTKRHAAASPSSFFRINGLNSIYLNITATDEANQLTLSSQVYESVSRLRNVLPQGYQIELTNDQTEHIREELDTIYFRTAITILVLVLLVAVFTFNLRYLLLVVICLIANMAIDIILYYYIGIEIQLYSLAGIAISLNLIIDNIIVMTDHLIHRHDRRCFTSILAATLTTMGALSVVLFFDDDVRLNLQDFVRVLLVNLSTSLAVAYWLVPALTERLRVDASVHTNLLRYKMRRGNVYFIRGYARLVTVLLRFRWLALAVIFITFGTSLYMFVHHVYEGSYLGRNDWEPTLSISATLPNGSTLGQMDTMVRKMESYLSQFKEVSQFQTNIYNARNALITVRFRPQYARSGFPYRLKSYIVRKALTMGGGSWGVYGLRDQDFSNDVRETAGSYEVILSGYNYDTLEQYAERFRQHLLQNKRIREVNIDAEFSWWKEDYSEFCLEVDKEKLANAGMDVARLYESIQPVFSYNIACGQASGESVLLSSAQRSEYDEWALMNMPISMDDKSYKVSDFASLTRRNTSQAVVKHNQQYTLCLQYEYIGSARQGRRLLKQDVASYNRILPLGYTVRENSEWTSWSEKMSGQYVLLIPVVVIIFFITAILFNSLLQPLLIILLIPISYIGVFLTFYLFHLKFDQGGFASFVLLGGITVNAAIYLLNEFNVLRRQYPFRSSFDIYLGACKAKVTAIFMTVISTVLGFVPFVIGTAHESFWFPLAVGTMGGMLMSLFALFFYLPLLLFWRTPK